MDTKVLKKYLGGKKFWKQTIVLALPIALQNLLTSSFILVDTIMVGQLGDVALSSVGMAGQWGWLLNMVTFGVCSGAAVFVSQYWGAGDIKGIHKICGLSVIIGLIISAIFMSPAFFAPNKVISIFNRDPNVITTGSAYLIIACFSYPGSVLNMILSAILRSTEQVKLLVFVALFTTVANAVLDYALIFGAFGLPEMGVKGAALATCLSAWMGPILLIICSLIKKNILYAPLSEIFSIDKKLIKAFLITAAPVVLNESLWGIGTFLYNVIFANLGYENYAAVTILKTIENIAFVFFVGMCNACSVLLGKNIGSGNVEDAVKDSKRFGVIIPLLGFVVGMTVIALRSQLIGLFNLTGELTETTIGIAKIIMVLYGIELGIRNIPYAFIVGIFRSGGDTINGAKFDTLSLWFIALPLTAIMAFVVKAPFVAVYAAMYIGEDYIKSFLCLRHYRTYKWIKPVTEVGQVSMERFMEKRKLQLKSE